MPADNFWGKIKHKTTSCCLLSFMLQGRVYFPDIKKLCRKALYGLGGKVPRENGRTNTIRRPRATKFQQSRRKWQYKSEAGK